MSTDDIPPDVAEALERLRGRRADAIINASTSRIVTETKGQNRKTRRANLAKLRAEVKARRNALTTTVTLADPDSVSTLDERRTIEDFDYGTACDIFGKPVVDSYYANKEAGICQLTGIVTVTGVGQ